MDHLSEINFKAIQEAINRLTSRIEGQEKRINGYIQTNNMLLQELTTLKQEIMILKANSFGSGPTEIV